MRPVEPGDFPDWEEFEEWKERWLGNLKKCALATRVGHFNPNVEMDTGEVGVCLTSRQARTIFGDKIARSGKARRLGCGTFACAWQRGQRKAVKITRDPDDVLALLESQGLRHVVRIDRAYRLPGSGLDADGDQVTLYGLIGEKLEPLDEMRTEWLQSFPYRTTARHFEEHYGVEFLTPGDPGADKTYSFGDELTESIVSGVCYYTDEERACRRFTKSVISTMEGLGRRGINWVDIHEGNVGMTRSGTWKILDLGISGTQEEPSEEQAPPIRGVLFRGAGAGRRVRLPLLAVALATLAAGSWLVWKAR